MIAAVVTLGVVAVVLAVVVCVLLVMQSRERERWSDERRRLVDRAIARHSGEIIAFDRQAKADPPKEREEPKLPVGLG